MSQSFNVKIPDVLVPKTGTRTSSFWVLIAAWLVGGLFTGLFSMLEAKGYLDRDGAPAVRQWLVEQIAGLLPVVYLTVSGWMTKKYIEARGRVAEQKAATLGDVVRQQIASESSGPVQGTTGTTLRSIAAPVVALVLLLNLNPAGCGGKGGSGQKSLRAQVVEQSDRLANSMKAATGALSDLHRHGKISKEKALDYAERLREANRIHGELHAEVNAWLIEVEEARRAAEARGEKWIEPQMPVELKATLVAGLVRIEEVLRGEGGGVDAFASYAGDVVAIVKSLREVLSR
jgi:hypothetical protein